MAWLFSCLGLVALCAAGFRWDVRVLYALEGYSHSGPHVLRASDTGEERTVSLFYFDSLLIPGGVECEVAWRTGPFSVHRHRLGDFHRCDFGTAYVSSNGRDLALEMDLQNFMPGVHRIKTRYSLIGDCLVEQKRRQGAFVSIEVEKDGRCWVEGNLADMPSLGDILEAEAEGRKKPLNGLRLVLSVDRQASKESLERVLRRLAQENVGGVSLRSPPGSKEVPLDLAPWAPSKEADATDTGLDDSLQPPEIVPPPLPPAEPVEEEQPFSPGG